MSSYQEKLVSVFYKEGIIEEPRDLLVAFLYALLGAFVVFALVSPWYATYIIMNSLGYSGFESFVIATGSVTVFAVYVRVK